MRTQFLTAFVIAILCSLSTAEAVRPPEFLGSVELPNSDRSVIASSPDGRLLYAASAIRIQKDGREAGRDAHLRVIDAEDPRSPHVVSNLALGDLLPQQIEVAGEKLLIRTRNGSAASVLVLDRSVPTAVRMLMDNPTAELLNSIRVLDNRTVWLDGYTSLIDIDHSGELNDTAVRVEQGYFAEALVAGATRNLLVVSSLFRNAVGYWPVGSERDKEFQALEMGFGAAWPLPDRRVLVARGHSETVSIFEARGDALVRRSQPPAMGEIADVAWPLVLALPTSRSLRIADLSADDRLTDLRLAFDADINGARLLPGRNIAVVRKNEGLELYSTTPAPFSAERLRIAYDWVKAGNDRYGHEAIMRLEGNGITNLVAQPDLLPIEETIPILVDYARLLSQTTPTGGSPPRWRESLRVWETLVALASGRQSFWGQLANTLRQSVWQASLFTEKQALAARAMEAYERFDALGGEITPEIAAFRKMNAANYVGDDACAYVRSFWTAQGRENEIFSDWLDEIDVGGKTYKIDIRYERGGDWSVDTFPEDLGFTTGDGDFINLVNFRDRTYFLIRGADITLQDPSNASTCKIR